MLGTHPAGKADLGKSRKVSVHRTFDLRAWSLLLTEPGTRAPTGASHKLHLQPHLAYQPEGEATIEQGEASPS